MCKKLSGGEFCGIADRHCVVEREEMTSFLC